MNNLIDGRAIAEEIHGETSEAVKKLKILGVEPCIVFVRVGDDPASKVYVGMKEKACSRLGVTSQTHILPENTSEQDLLKVLASLNRDPFVHGILVQAPLPKHIDSTKIYSSVSPRKDVDGFHPENVGKLMLGDRTGFIPCTPAGIHELLIRSKVQIEGSHVVILGRGNIVGKPMAALLMQKARHANATVTVCHSQSKNLEKHCLQADILIAALGSPEFVKAHMVREGATVVDVGVNRVLDASHSGGSCLVGDVDFKAVQKKAFKITPNPGGVGPMTIAMLLRNTVTAAQMSKK